MIEEEGAGLGRWAAVDCAERVFFSFFFTVFFFVFFRNRVGTTWRQEGEREREGKKEKKKNGDGGGGALR